jgi:hypothetical protein
MDLDQCLKSIKITKKYPRVSKNNLKKQIFSIPRYPMNIFLDCVWTRHTVVMYEGWNGTWILETNLIIFL